jgi:hypothetical protein
MVQDAKDRGSSGQGLKPEELMELVKRIHEHSLNGKELDVKPVEIPETGRETDIVAVDGSYTFLFCISNTWIGIVRACAMQYGCDDSGYKLKDIRFSEKPVIISRREELIAGDEETMKIFRSAQPGSDEFEGRMINGLRAHSEELLALDVSSNIKDSTIAMDGPLYKSPHGSMVELAEVCRKNRNALIGVSKDSTTHMFGSMKTDEELLRDLSSGRAYVSVGKQDNIIGEVQFAKLHPNADKWFRVDVSAEGGESGVLSNLARYSRSELCLGYPYPLLEAHRFVVAVRYFQEAYEQEVMRSALELGMPVDRILENMTKWEGERKGAFHEYLDKVARSMR